MDGLNDGIGLRREEAVNQVRAGDRLGLRATVALEFGPDAGKSKQRSVIAQGEPDNVLFLGQRVRLWSVFGKAIGRGLGNGSQASTNPANAAKTYCGYW